MIKTLAIQSSHPLCRMLVKKLADTTASRRTLSHFQEMDGAGIKAFWGKTEVKLGSAIWVGSANLIKKTDNASHVYAAVDGKIRGYFTLKSKYRPELEKTVKVLQDKGFGTYLLSGDKPTDKNLLAPVFGNESHLLFEQKPEQKLHFIKNLQQVQQKNVLMIGDGLNDAGALRQSDVGLAVSDDINNFSPACDAIIEGNQLIRLPAFINLAKSGQKIIKLSFAISLLYNVFGLTFAVSGKLSPVIAAILMPVSSITIVLFTTVTSNLAARKWLKN